MNVFDMKKSDFKSVPIIPWNNNKNIEFDSLVIIPKTTKHESGFRNMAYCAIKKGEPIGIFGGGSDVIHLDGIGGYGDFKVSLPKYFDRKAWSMDCLPCGYLRLWCDNYTLVARDCLSDFNLYTEKK